MSDSPGAPARFLDLCLDAHDHQALADWWCAAMGYVWRDPGDPDVAGPVLIVDPSGAGPRILPVIITASAGSHARR
ncbi:VOC family protein [Modestobacter sp. SYSU DS0875]